MSDVTPAEHELPLIISVDDHIMEPKDLWQRELPASLRGRGPKVSREKVRREFKGGQILSSDKIHYTIQHNCLLVSASVAAIEDAIIQHEKNNQLFAKPEFASAWQVMSSDDFLNFACRSGALSWMQLNPLLREGS